MERVSVSENESSEAVDGTHLTQLASGEETSIQFFEFDPDSKVPEHSHHHEQTGFLYEGTVTFVSGGEEFVVEAGDSFSIPGDEPHSVTNHSDAVARGVDVFSPPRPDPDWAE